MARCQCGCGGQVAIAKRTNKALGHVRGQPVRFIPGHHRRGAYPPLRERFKSRVKTGAPDECWEWQGGRLPAGYGAIWDNEIKNNRGAHRLAWEFAFGQIPAGLFVCHRCDNPPCCNPAHLFLGTKEDNDNDRVRKGRTSRAGAKLSTAEVVGIRALAADGFAPRDLAMTFGVSPTTVYDIIKRKTWRDL